MYLIDERIRTKLQIEWCKILEIKSNKIKWREEIIENVYLTTKRNHHLFINNFTI